MDTILVDQFFNHKFKICLIKTTDYRVIILFRHRKFLIIKIEKLD